jgi:hypothetical protein
VQAETQARTVDDAREALERARAAWESLAALVPDANPNDVEEVALHIREKVRGLERTAGRVLELEDRVRHMVAIGLGGRFR